MTMLLIRSARKYSWVDANYLLPFIQRKLNFEIMIKSSRKLVLQYNLFYLCVTIGEWPLSFIKLLLLFDCSSNEKPRWIYFLGENFGKHLLSRKCKHEILICLRLKKALELELILSQRFCGWQWRSRKCGGKSCKRWLSLTARSLFTLRTTSQTVLTERSYFT